MAELAKEILLVNIEDEMKQSYLDYAMSVIVGRALPDVRDGLKPVHRRVLYAMRELGNDWNKPYKKSARVVGDVIGKYHPHGDTAVYDTIVRMAQPFAMRYLLVDGQGNFGSVDGDAPAAMRYTEVRMSKLAHEMLADIDKETVDFAPNYDESENEPTVLPSRVPGLLVNGATGIAVGMATNMPPHNLRETIAAAIALIDNPDASLEELMVHLPGPDFPTAGLINGAEGIHEAYATGRGRVIMRSRSHVEDVGDGAKQQLVVTELPYQVNKANLLKKIADLVNAKKLEGITDLRDESDKDGMRMVIELRRGEVPEVVLNNLFQHTVMETSFGINMVALVGGQPKLLTLREILAAFIAHRREVVTRRAIFELRKARDRAHVLEGLTVALANIDEVIELIKASSGPAEAKAALTGRTWRAGQVRELLQRAGAQASKPDDVAENVGLSGEHYQLSETQAQAILDLKLQRLTGLEQEKLVEEYTEILDVIAALLRILREPERLLEVIREELQTISEQYGDDRRTEILEQHIGLSLEDLITEEDVVVTMSHAGYAKSQPLDAYRAQRRGGKGISATAMKDEDFVDQLWIANTHDTLLCFTSRGRVYWIKVYELPNASRAARGKPIVNLLPLEKDERVNAVLPVREYRDDQYVFFCTRSGVVKKTALKDFSRPRSTGIIAVDLLDDDQLIDVVLTDGELDIMLVTSEGKAVTFDENDVRAMGRTARGVKGVTLPKGHHVVSLLTVRGDDELLIASENGFGKRTQTSDFPRHRRGGQGVIAIQTSARNGNCIGAIKIESGDEVMLISNGGTLVRTRADEVSTLGRNAQGVTLIRLAKKEQLVGLGRIRDTDEVVDDLSDTASSDDTASVSDEDGPAATP